MSQRRQLLGVRLPGSLLVPIELSSAINGRLRYLCQCDCGNKATVLAGNLLRGATKSCGCWRREFIRATKKKPGSSSARKVFSTYKNSAKRRSYEFAISFDEFVEITLRNCHYCGNPPSNSATKRNFEPYVYNGIDRANNKVGYVITNCVPCCKICNRMKESLTATQFHEHIRQIQEHTLARLLAA